jgi:hypothetical protein
MKIMLRRLVLMHLINSISREIHRHRSDWNMAPRVASLANYLILLKLPGQLKKPFNKFAVKQNIKIGNNLTASKLDKTVCAGVNNTVYPDHCP